MEVPDGFSVSLFAGEPAGNAADHLCRLEWGLIEVKYYQAEEPRENETLPITVPNRSERQ